MSRIARNVGCIETLEARCLLAGNVTASLSSGILRITGDSAANQIKLRTRDVPVTGQAVVVSGSTGMTLNTDRLASEAGLTFSKSNTYGTPITAFVLGFPMSEDTDLTYSSNAFNGAVGLLRHIGTVSFNNGDIIVGDFEIGYDKSREAGKNTGFYVRDTVGGLGILFDLAKPTTGLPLSNTETLFAISTANLAISPELAQALQTRNLTNADHTGLEVGTIGTSAVSTRASRAVIEVLGTGTTINGGNSNVRFTRSGVRTVRLSTLGGDDEVIMEAFRYSGRFSLDTGDGNDEVYFSSVNLSQNTSLALGAGDDYANIFNSRGSRSFAIDGGAGSDILIRRATDFSSFTNPNFEKVLPA